MAEGAVSLTGNDITSLSDHIFKNLADGDAVVLDFPNDIAAGKVGKNGNLIIAFNATGKTVNMQIRVLAGSSDDKYLNSRYNEYLNDPPSFILFNGEFTKRVGDGKGGVNSIVYSMNQGYFTKPPVTKENVEGDTEQAVAIWNLSFPNTDRGIS